MPAVYNQLRINHVLQVTSEAQNEKIIPIQLIKRKLVVVELKCDKFLYNAESIRNIVTIC